MPSWVWGLLLFLALPVMKAAGDVVREGRDPTALDKWLSSSWATKMKRYLRWIVFSILISSILFALIMDFFGQINGESGDGLGIAGLITIFLLSFLYGTKDWN